MIILARNLSPSDAERLGPNLAAAVRDDRDGHRSAAERSLSAIGERVIDWLDPHRDGDSDDNDPDAGAAGVLVPA